MQRKARPLAGILTLLDVDEFLRRRKAAMRKELQRVIQRCRKLGMTIGFVTGAPLQHVYHLTPVDIILAESGAVKICNGTSVICQESSAAIESFLSSIGLSKCVDGRHDTEYGSIIVEGHRRASFTALCEGVPPHYSSHHATAPRHEVEKWFAAAIERISIPLVISAGNDQNYHWIDIIHPKKTKSNSVRQLLQEYPHRHVYYGGDGNNDLLVVQENESVIPLATRNCIAPMRQEAQQRGVYMDEDGPEGGVEKVLCSLIERHLGYPG